MKKLLEAKNLPLFAALAGIVGCLLRRQLYIWGMDDKGLLKANHPLEILLWLVTAAALGLILARVWKLDGSNRYRDNFVPSKGAAVGHVLFGLGILLTVLLNEPLLNGNLGRIWKGLGFLSFPCLILAGLARAKGRRPFFAMHMVPCLFLVFHIIDHYQLWSGNPQVQDYMFTLLGTMVLMFYAYYTAAFDVGSGKRRMHLGFGLAAMYLCIVILSRTDHLFLYAGGIFWVQSDLCALEPKPRAPKPQEGENANGPA